MKYVIISISVLSFLFSSCTKMNDLHDVYLKRGEKIYVGKLDSAYIFPGKERVKLRFWPSDPRATKMVIYWQSRSDSMLVDITPEIVGDSSDVIIKSLPEYDHIFEVVTMNNDFSNRSIPYTVTGSVYGERYQSITANRVINEIFQDTLSESWVIKWLGKVETGIGSEIIYNTVDGEQMKVYTPMSENVTMLENLKSDLRYRTLFLPETDAIDTFYTGFTEVPLQ
ncbi:DUF4998 domain-containing protein [Membranicola marinus]|uniref:DUF4998 domain-containing protein n=1 Tax=Membranihabitans marinus TaxID=1227546 RepID=A0A953HJM3_9BACT|nr:DUF4998 domain-containing protein [Membranihabitans marinus]MBY5956932.1 DUF4998 domain-containing protein [Membranihabitans marinus]